MIPVAWRDKLAHVYLPELLVSIIGAGSLAFGVTIVTMPDRYREIPSFAQAFDLVPPAWWGTIMLCLGAVALALLAHSRAATAVPMFALGGVWILWVVPIALSPGFAPSAPIAYGMISLLTLASALACLVPREEKP